MSIFTRKKLIVLPCETRTTQGDYLPCDSLCVVIKKNDNLVTILSSMGIFDFVLGNL